MRVLWLCNVMLPMIAEQLKMEASNKEGWIAGLADVCLQKRQENHIELAVAFPVSEELISPGESYFHRVLPAMGYELSCYGFRENTQNPENYDAGLEKVMREITDDYKPDVIHCFGTEYPHTLAMCKAFPDKNRLLITIQGLCSVYANVYFADLPEEVIHSVTFRDLIKQDTLVKQHEKFVKRGEMEIAALKLTANVGGRTPWDYHYAKEWNPGVTYYVMNETLRRDFYEDTWKKEACQPHSIFISQGDYPIKGLHYMLKALPEILEEYPDTMVYVAGNSLVGYETLKQKLKLSAYGKYLRKLLYENHLEDKVVFLGRLTGAQMKEQYLKSHLFVCCSAIENSPNSLGEAMLLGMPCVSANVGGVPGIFIDGEDGILYEGCRSVQNSFDHVTQNSDLTQVSKNLSEAVRTIFRDENKALAYGKSAREHAKRKHDRENNYVETVKVYTEIAQRANGCSEVGRGGEEK